MTEAEFFAEILLLCQGRDLWPVPVKPERFANRIGESRGFVDLMIVGPGGVLFRELKTDKAGRNLRSTQTVWKHRLAAAAQDWDVWTPRDLTKGRIAKQLDGLEQPDEYTDMFALAMARDSEPEPEAE